MSAQICQALLVAQQATGVTLSGGKAYFYVAGSSEAQLGTIYLDRNQTQVAPNPCTLDANGTAAIYGSGLYDIKITDASNVQKFNWLGFELISQLVEAQSSDYASLNDAITAIGSTPTTLNIVTPNFPMSGIATVPSTLALNFIYPGSIANSYALTINGPFSAGNYQIFTGSGAVTGLKEARPEWWGAKGDGSTDDADAWDKALAALGTNSTFIAKSAKGYKFSRTINITDKKYCVFDFGNSPLDFTSITNNTPGLHFKGLSYSHIDNILALGNLGVSQTVWFDSAASPYYPTVQAVIGKVYAIGGAIGIQIGDQDDSQVDDCNFQELYAAPSSDIAGDLGYGIKVTGQNTLANVFTRMAAYRANTAGVWLEEGGGSSILALHVSSSPIDVLLGKTDGSNGYKLARWDILSGYAEMGTNNEQFLSSYKGTGPAGQLFTEQVTFNHMRITAFSNTNPIFAAWNLNGDLIFKDSTLTVGASLYNHIDVDYNSSGRIPTVKIDGNIIESTNAFPPTSSDLAGMKVKLSGSARLYIKSAYSNVISEWDNAGSVDFGPTPGIDFDKTDRFKQALLTIPNLVSAWDFKDLSNGSPTNMITGAPAFASSPAVTTDDIHYYNGLIGLFSTGAYSSKTLSVTDSRFAITASGATFAAIVRSLTASDIPQDLALGGASGMRLTLNSSGGFYAQVFLGAVNSYVAMTGYDAYLLIARYVSGTSLTIDAINLRTGAIGNSVASSSIPVYSALTWTNTVSMTSKGLVKALPAVWNRPLTDSEVSILQQAALQLYQ